MKKILILIFLCVIFSFTGCTEESSSNSINNKETEGTENMTEYTSESQEETKDMEKDYLIDLAEQLKIGMQEEEITDRIGTPDKYLGSGILNLWVYRKGKYELYVNIDPYNKIDKIYIYDSETEKTVIDYTE